MSGLLVAIYAVGLVLVCAGVWWLTLDRAFVLFAGALYTPEFVLERVYPAHAGWVRVVFLSAMVVAGFYFGRRRGR